MSQAIKLGSRVCAPASISPSDTRHSFFPIRFSRYFAAYYVPGPELASEDSKDEALSPCSQVALCWGQNLTVNPN